MKQVSEALAEMVGAFAPVGSERVMLQQALGRHLAAEVIARSDAPPFDNSAMDGYAVRAEDVAHASEDTPTALPVEGESRAGGPTPPVLKPRTAQRIFTGAPVPEGADAVVIQENVDRQQDVAHVRAAAAARANIRHAGSDLAKGAVALAAGSPVGPGEIGLMASQDMAVAQVYRRPTVAIISTGDELRDVGEPPRPGSIVNSNAYALAAQVTQAGAVPWVLPTAQDQLDSVTERVRQALRADVVCVTGGVSVGDYDVVRQGLTDAGVELSFWKIRMKPGKPVAFGLTEREGRRIPVVGLPGNPVSAWVTFEVFVRPGVRRMLGDPRPYRRPIQVPLGHAHRHSTGRVEFARARLSEEEGRTIAHLHARQGSGSLPSLTGLDALAVLPADQENFAQGEPVTALLLGGPGCSTPGV